MSIDIAGNSTRLGVRKRFRQLAPAIIACSLSFLLLGSVTFVFAFDWPTTKQGVTSLLPFGNLVPQARVHQPIPTNSPVMKSTPTTTRTPQPTPRPITPLPFYVQQQVAVLEAHDRFFYHGNPYLPEIALTLDDGPNPTYTSQVLSILKHYGIKATFFCMGSRVQQYPYLVKQEYQQGHSVENHTWSHPFMPDLSEPSLIWQITTTSNIIERVTGERPTLFRPPYGAFTAPVLKVVNTLGLSTFIWNDDPEDWSQPGTNTIISRVLNRIGYGSIILMHDGGGDRSQTVAALPTIIEWLQSHGYTFVTLKQLVHDVHRTRAGLSSSPLADQPPLTQLDMWRRKISPIVSL